MLLDKKLTDSAIFTKFSSLEIPNAKSTWKSQDLPTTQADGALTLIMAAKPGSFSALLPVFLVMPKAVNVEFLNSIFSEKNCVSVSFAPGHPPSI